MNNSGETETFKFSGYTSPIIPANGSNSVRSIYFSSSNNSSPYGVLIGGANTNTIPSTGNYNAIIGGEGSTITSGEDNGIFAAKNSTTDASSNYSVIIGGRTHTVNNQFGAILGGAQNTAGYLSATIAGFNITATNQSTAINGENNTTSAVYGGIYGGTGNNATGNYSAIYNSQTSSLNALQSAIIGGGSNQITGGGYREIILGGAGNTISNDNDNQILGGGTNSINGGYFSTIINGSSNAMTGNYSRYSTIIVGLNNTMTATDRSGIYNCYNCNITNAGYYTTIIGSDTSTISSSAVRNSIISSVNSTITGTTSGVVMLGTSGRTATQNYATHVENLVVFNYSNLNYADDTAAAAGGVVLGQVYHNAGALRIRIV
jgi:hypothetical protein